jgi:hypothetical protein
VEGDEFGRAAFPPLPQSFRVDEMWRGILLGEELGFGLAREMWPCVGQGSSEYPCEKRAEQAEASMCLAQCPSHASGHSIPSAFVWVNERGGASNEFGVAF